MRLKRHLRLWLLLVLSVAVTCTTQALLTKGQGQGLPPFPPDAATVRLLFPGSVEAGEITAAQPSVRYLLLAVGGDQLSASLVRVDGDLAPSLTLTNAATNEVLETQGADLAGRRANLKFTLPDRGWYYLDATSEKGDTTGHFALRAFGFSSELYALLKVGVPPPLPDAEAILRGGRVTLLGKGKSRFVIPLADQQQLALNLTGKGALSLSVGKDKDPAPVSQTGTDQVSVDYTAAGDQWAVVALDSAAADSTLLVELSAAGTAVALVPDNLTTLITPTSTLTATNTLTPTATYTPTATHTPLPTKVVITSLNVRAAADEDEAINTDTIWVFFGGFKELKAPGTKHYESRQIYSNPYMMRYAFCFDRESLRAQGLPSVSVQFYVDDLPLDPSDVLIFDRTTRQGDYCRYWATRLSGWPDGGAVNLRIEMDLSQDVEVGARDVRPAGKYVYEVVMNVRPA